MTGQELRLASGAMEVLDARRLPAHDLRSTLLELLADQDGHGYQLADRLSALGIETGLTSLYRALRLMDRAGEVRSTWAVSSGPARRVYTLTDAGLARLRESGGILRP